MANSLRLVLTALVIMSGASIGRANSPTPFELKSDNEREAAAGGDGGHVPTEGADVIVGSINNLREFGREGGRTHRIVAIAASPTICNKGSIEVHMDALPHTNHPVIGQAFYRLSSQKGVTHMEQLGYSWLLHTFAALTGNVCGFGCVAPGTATLIGVGCSSPDSSGISAHACSLGARSVVHPFTGVFPAGSVFNSGGGCSLNYPSMNHIGHEHDGIAHRLQVRESDLAPALNDGARYFVEIQVIVPHEFTAGNGNQFNNVSHREYEVSQPNYSTRFDFEFVGSTQQESAAIDAWTTASRSIIEPAPMEDGRAILAYEVTQLGDALWHYEYAIYNMNLDAAVDLFSIPHPRGVSLSNVDFHQPHHHAPEANAPNYSPDPWATDVGDNSITWNTDSFDAEPLANAIRYGTTYNFRFDVDAPPQKAVAHVGIFKSGQILEVPTLAPAEPAVPRILHGTLGVPFGNRAFSGFIDPRASMIDNAAAGISRITIQFNSPVRDADGSTLTTDGFVVRQTGGRPPPGVIGVEMIDDSTVAVILDRPISPMEWSTIEAHVESAESAIPISTLGDQGPEIDEPDRIDIAFLPLDVDQNGRVDLRDLLRYRQFLSETAQPPVGVPNDFTDTNRDGETAPQDLLLFRSLWQQWNGRRLNAAQP